MGMALRTAKRSRRLLSEIRKIWSERGVLDETFSETHRG